MKIYLNERDISLTEKDGLWSYRLNGDILVENIPSKEEALKDAEKKSKTLLRGVIKKTYDE